MIRIDNTQLPAPTAMSVQRSDRRGTCAVATDGALVRDFAGMKYEVTLRFALLSAGQAALLNRFASAGEAFRAELPLPGGEESILCICTGLTAGLMSYENGAPLWQDVSVFLEEV